MAEPPGPVKRLLERVKRVEDPTLRTFALYARAMPHWAARGHVRRTRVVERYLAGTDAPRLQIGVGPNGLPGWLDADLIAGDVFLDLTRPLPLPDACFAYVLGEHVIEHIPDRSAERLLAELRRILRPDGVLRLTTPDLRKHIALYEDRSPVVSREEYCRVLDRASGRPHERPAQMLNDAMRLWGHRWIYDEDDLVARLRGAGFEGIVRVESGESEHPVLRNLERHGDVDWLNRAEAMTLEAGAASPVVGR